jgi:hypothetical protein
MSVPPALQEVPPRTKAARMAHFNFANHQELQDAAMKQSIKGCLSADALLTALEAEEVEMGSAVDSAYRTHSSHKAKPGARKRRSHNW